MNRRLPPLSALRAFEAAARHGSFKQAAQELAVTPTAVSHQVRALEAHTGLALFERQTRKVVLTDAGAQLSAVLREGFDAFADVLDRLARRRTRVQVTISATIAFTARWLVPRVSAFRALYPDIDLQLQASDDVIDLSRSQVDIAIRYGTGPYPGFDAALLFGDCFAPVVNPMLNVGTAADLMQRPRIDFQWRRRRPDNPTWTRWFAAAGLPEPAEPPQLRFSDESHAIQAAVAGQGIALVSSVLVKDELAAGHLVRPFGPSIPGFRYHLLTRANEKAAATIVAAQWLLSEAEAARTESDSSMTRARSA